MADKHITLTQLYLQETFNYVDGELYWKVKHNQKMVLGSKAGATSSNNRISVQINNKSYLLHRLIYLFHKGNLPKYIDHIDGNPQNNKIDNLRPTTKIQNAYNSKLSVNNKSGIKGVMRKNNKWYVVCTVNKKRHYLGYFDNLDVAKNIAESFRIANHGEFSRIA